MFEPISIVPPPGRCAGGCGVDQICDSVTFKNGYCLKPWMRTVEALVKARLKERHGTWLSPSVKSVETPHKDTGGDSGSVSPASVRG